MKEINRHGGGAIFEAMGEAQVDLFVKRCWTLSREEGVATIESTQFISPPSLD